ncbi:HNH endonuclease [Hydrogenovibrio thermophilus]|jgi:hypothetical protein|uniref:HNH endonuclease n=1 Tax=Hydrogenovibrio thermophilus TaxID=265883 RepID=A0A410H4C8_9GAMM|nr:HNH endonuclease [Hydrogenovibrio thermophilus]QAB15670.1 HNH endonuclease [Hydrogenovibrio thermophilus]
MKGYTQKNWKTFREEVIELDGKVCSICGRGEPDVYLQVHHKRYVQNKLPWEYPYKDCITLCKGCHAAEHGKVPPKFGWEYVGYDDLGDLIGICELCGSSLRHQFFVFHENWGTMEVGTYCCDSLLDTEIASNQVDSKKRYENRKKRFIQSSRWKSSCNTHKIKQNKISVVISLNENKYYIAMDDFKGKRLFHTIDEAKEHVFKVIENGEASKYLEQHK